MLVFMNLCFFREIRDEQGRPAALIQLWNLETRWNGGGATSFLPKGE